MTTLGVSVGDHQSLATAYWQTGATHFSVQNIPPISSAQSALLLAAKAWENLGDLLSTSSQPIAVSMVGIEAAPNPRIYECQIRNSEEDRWWAAAICYELAARILFKTGEEISHIRQVVANGIVAAENIAVPSDAPLILAHVQDILARLHSMQWQITQESRSMDAAMQALQKSTTHFEQLAKQDRRYHFHLAMNYQSLASLQQDSDQAGRFRDKAQKSARLFLAQRGPRSGIFYTQLDLPADRAAKAILFGSTV